MRLRCFWLLLMLAPLAFGQGPVVADNGVLNAASFAKQGQPGAAVTPGSLVAIFGTNFATSLAQADTIPLSTTLNNVSVSFNDVSAPLLFVAQAQINAQLPWNVLPADASSGTATVVVTSSGVASPPRTIQIGQFSPGIFTVNGNGIGFAIAVNVNDGTLAQPVGSVAGLNPAPHPASVGGAIIIYCTGLGPVDPPVVNGTNSLDTLRNTTTKPDVLIDGIPAQVLFSGLSPHFVGVNQVNVVVPPGVRKADGVPLQIRIGGITSSNLVTIAVQ